MRATLSLRPPRRAGRAARCVMAAGAALILLIACFGGPAAEPVVLNVAMREAVFEPDAFTVPRGVRVVIRYDNPSPFIHNVLIMSKETQGQDYGSPMVVKTGERGTIEAVFPNTGLVEFVCSFHPGMDGTITVY